MSQSVTIHAPPGQSVTWTLVGASNGLSANAIVVNMPHFRVGRRKDMDLSIDSPAVSGFHAELLLIQNGLFVRDVGSTNGSFVNGTRILQQVELHDGDCLDLGGTIFRIVQKRPPNPNQPPTAASALKTSFLADAVDAIGRRSLIRLLSGGSLAPCYQAIHDLRSGCLAGYEFLARSTYPGIETAGQLFAQAAKAGREVDLSLLCREQAFIHSRLLKNSVSVFVNTHPAEPLLDVVLPQMRLLRTAYPDQGMVLEIHEAANTDPDMVLTLRRELADVNVQLAFDDFGAGQARIREMISASADFIKFDPSLIRDLQRLTPDQRRFFASIVAGIKSEGTITIAEGIETAEMADVCHDVGFDLVQGYLYSRPTIMQESPAP